MKPLVREGWRGIVAERSRIHFLQTYKEATRLTRAVLQMVLCASGRVFLDLLQLRSAMLRSFPALLLAVGQLATTVSAANMVFGAYGNRNCEACLDKTFQSCPGDYQTRSYATVSKSHPTSNRPARRSIPILFHKEPNNPVTACNVIFTLVLVHVRRQRRRQRRHLHERLLRPVLQPHCRHVLVHVLHHVLQGVVPQCQGIL